MRWIGGDSVTPTARGRSSIARGRSPRQLGRASRESKTIMPIRRDLGKRTAKMADMTGLFSYRLV